MKTINWSSGVDAERTRSRKLRLLVSAYACLPGQVSEGGMAWSYVWAAARRHEVWVITRTHFRESIERELAASPERNLNFIYYDLPAVVRWFKREGQPTQFYYYLWQLFAAWPARRLAATVDFDIAHHVTFAKYWAPSLLAFQKLPYVWGPVGGGESAPASFWANFGMRGTVYEVFRSVARWLADHDPMVRLTGRRCGLALGTTDETSERLRAVGARHVRTYHAIALATEEVEMLREVPLRQHGGCRFISIGRLLHWKGFDLGIEAFAKAGIDDSEYWIIGDGPESHRLKALAQRLGIADRVSFLGSQARPKTLERLGECDVLVHPSLHESGGIVCLEAMATGRPVICLDLGGPALQVTDEVGMRIPAGRRDQAVAGIAKAMTVLARDPDLRKKMGEAGRTRVAGREYSWDRKLEIYDSVYREVLDRSAADRRA
jgi:glycosyltransferase involved in cell wall biosynthesis